MQSLRRSTRSLVLPMRAPAALSLAAAGPGPARAYSTYRVAGASLLGRGSAITGTGAVRSSAASLSLPLPLPLPSSSLLLLPVRHATKKAGGSSKNSQDSIGKRLGLKKSGGQPVKAGNILTRQHGTLVHPGKNVGHARDHTLWALVDGTVAFTYVHLAMRTRNKLRKFIHVLRDGDTLESVRAETKVQGAALMELFRQHKDGRRHLSPKASFEHQQRQNKAKADRDAQAKALQAAIAQGGAQQAEAEAGAKAEGAAADKPAALQNHPMWNILLERKQQQATKA